MCHRKNPTPIKTNTREKQACIAVTLICLENIPCYYRHFVLIFYLMYFAKKKTKIKNKNFLIKKDKEMVKIQKKKTKKIKFHLDKKEQKYPEVEIG